MAAALDLGTLNSIYKEADAIDRETFAEMRSNVLLIAGLHYSKAGKNQMEARAREGGMTEQQKLRLTMNHIHKIHKRYVQAVLSYASGVTISPQRGDELQDQKAADLNLSVWQDAKYRYGLREQIRKWAGDFCGIGEVGLKLFWDPNAGELLGYEQAVGDDGQPMLDEQGQPLADEKKPIFQGKMCFERLYCFNLLRDPAAKDMLDSSYLVIRKMTPTAWLKKRYAKDPAKLKMLDQKTDEEFIVFDAARMGYERSKNHTMVKEIYYRPCVDYPEGYFVIWTTAGILEEGPLPFGIFPIKWKGFDENASTPRATSLVKQARPYQAEINRASSQQAMHQITIADDKILYQKNSQVTSGVLLPGVRGIAYQGKEPQILAGRDGSQYLNYILAKVAELYKVMDVDELEDEKSSGQMEPFALLFRAARQKQRFSIYSEKFEEFLVDVVKTFLELAKHYYPDDMLIPAVGAKEYINMAEFRSTVALNYQIHVEAVDDTLESKFGKQLTMQNIMQYAGPQLSKNDIGRLVKNMPLVNSDEVTEDLTMDYENAKNDMLALERGEFNKPESDDNHPYIIQKLSRRMKQADFRFLRPEIKKLYEIKKTMHQEMEAERQQKLLDAKNEYIPADGPMIACDMYVENKEDPTKAPHRARIPQRALDWLVQKLESQGADLAKLEQMNEGAMAEMADMLLKRGRGGMPQQPKPQLPMLGATG